MCSNKVDCPNCLGVKQIMVPNEKRGFHYENCNLCKGSGEVVPEVAEDFVISLNEDIIDDYELE